VAIELDRILLALLAGSLIACSGVGSPKPVGEQPGPVEGAGGAGGASLTLVVGTGGIFTEPGLTGGNPAPTAEENCGNSAKNMTQVPADLLLVLDRSGSMTNDIASDNPCTTGSTTCAERWSTMIQAMRIVLAGSPASINWGLKFFSSPSWTGEQGTTPKGCVVLPEMEVPIGTGNSEAIVGSIAAAIPNYNTPTRAAIDTASAYLTKLSDGRSKYILLATDGEPNCAAAGPYPTSDDREATLRSIAAAKAAGIATYVIGVGPTADKLTEMAVKGGTGQFYPAVSPQALIAALQAIVGSIASCVYTMSSTPPDPNNLGVYLNKDLVAQSPTDGWTLSSPDAVTFHGPTCDRIKAGLYTDVQVLFGCPGTAPLPIRID
jgi:hypothetical protein